MRGATQLVERRRAAENANWAECSQWICAFAALIVTSIFYLLFLPLIQKSFVGQLFILSRWVGWTIIFLGTWSLAFLYLKWKNYRRLLPLLSLDLLPQSISARLTKENASLFSRALRHHVLKPDRHPLSRRISTAIKFLDYGRSNFEIIQVMNEEAEKDLQRVESSYSLVHGFIWAIPILGFIGTVLGIGYAIGGFSNALQIAEELLEVKASLGHVISGLATAFNTTFLGLIVSIIIVFPANQLLKLERAFLREINDFCLNDLTRRLPEE